MSDPNRIHLLPERDRMMAETYEQTNEGSANPTGRAQPEPVPMVYRGPQVYREDEQGEAVDLGGTKEDAASEPVGKVVEPPTKTSPKGQTTATAKKSAAKKA